MAKAVLIPKPSPLPVIPPFLEFLGHLVGREVTGGVLFSRIQNNGGSHKAPFSERTLRNAMSIGVKVSTAQKIADWLGSSLPYELSPEEENERSRRWKKLGLKNNGLAWELGVILPVERLCPSDVYPNRAIRFLWQRIEAEYSFLSKLIKVESEQELSGLFWESLTTQKLLSTNIIRSGIAGYLDQFGAQDLGARGGVDFHRLCLHLRVDFAYSLMANYENDLIEQMVREVGAENVPPDIDETGLFGDLVPDHDSGEFKEPLSILFDQWRRTFSRVSEESLTNMDLARMLPYPHGLPPEHRGGISRKEEGLADVDEIRRIRLNAWVKGLKRPGAEHLSFLVENLVPDGHDPSWALLRAGWANALGRFIASERKNVQRAGLKLSDHEVTKMFCGYRRYRKHFVDPAVVDGSS